MIEETRKDNKRECFHRPVSSKEAAVLVPLFQGSHGEVRVLLTKRSRRLTTHPGEVSLPGGKRDPGDVDAIDTALRETEEELGIPRSSIDVITTLQPLLSKHKLSVTPVVGVICNVTVCQPNPDEVEDVFSVPLSMFMKAGPPYSFRDYVLDGLPYRVHYWEYSHEGIPDDLLMNLEVRRVTRASTSIHGGSFATKVTETYSSTQQVSTDVQTKTSTIWGLTAWILILVASKAFATEPDFETHPPGSPAVTDLAYENGRVVVMKK